MVIFHSYVSLPEGIFPTEKRPSLRYFIWLWPIYLDDLVEHGNFPRYLRLLRGKEPKKDCTNKTTRV